MKKGGEFMEIKNIKIAVITDVHGNLPALRAALKVIDELKCDVIYNLGDSIGIGPFPKECLELLLNLENLEMVMGNHEMYCAYGSPDYIKGEELHHHMWIEKEIDRELKLKIQKLPFMISKEYFKMKLTFIHYPIEKELGKFKEICKDISPNNLDKLFSGIDSDIVFYGHNHPFSDIQGKSRYINPGSLGCSKDSLARVTILDVSNNGYTIENLNVPYDKNLIFEEMKRRSVPNEEIISKIFFGRV